MLELAIARALFERFPDFSEGRMAKVRSHVVSRASCAVVARELQLGERLVQEAGNLAEGEVERLALNRNVLAALLEAALAALYLEHGFEAVEPAVVGSAASACWAAVCSASFFERPVPRPASTPSTIAAAVNVRSCGGPSTSSTV